MSNKAFGIIAEGHGVASGKTGDIRFPFGTLAMQIPIFEKRGMDFKQFFKGTINISLNLFNFELRNPKFFLRVLNGLMIYLLKTSLFLPVLLK